MSASVWEWIRPYRKIVVLGEAGSGKTELSVNLAKLVAEQSREKVLFLDMDQTKPSLRARDTEEDMKAFGVKLGEGDTFEDSPIVPYGVKDSLRNPDLRLIMDVGGSHAGAMCIGQFAKEIEDAKALVLYTIDPYRGFSDTTERIRQTMEEIFWASRLQDIHIVSNPFAGAKTTVDIFSTGHRKLIEQLAPLGYRPELVMVPAALQALVETSDIPQIVITSYLDRVYRLRPVRE